MNSKYSIEDIRVGIEKHLGKDVIVKANKGRKKIIVREGVIETTYPDIFVVRLKNNYDVDTRVSYSYADVLTSNVQLKLIRHDDEKE